MPCRLCHQKIPFFRSWFTVAEFCCDEHEQEYKELMVTRISAASAEIEPAPAAAPLIAEEEPEPDAANLDAEPEAELAPEPAPAAAPDVSADDAEELWRLADEVGSLGAPAPSPSPSPAGDPEPDAPATKPQARKRRRGKRNKGGAGEPGSA